MEKLWKFLHRKYSHTSTYKEFLQFSKKWENEFRRSGLNIFYKAGPFPLHGRGYRQAPILYSNGFFQQFIRKFDRRLYILQKTYTKLETKLYLQYHQRLNSSPILTQNNLLIRNLKQSEIYQAIARTLKQTGSPATVSIILANSAVFLLWQIATPMKYNVYTGQLVNQSLVSYEFLKNNFVTSWDHITRGRIHSAILANFSHFEFRHFFFNMLTTFFAGRAFESFFGSRALIISYLFNGICSMVMQSLFLKAEGRQNMPILGASGSMNGILMMVAIFQPMLKVYIYGIIPVPLYLIVGGIFLFEFFASRYIRDNSAHEGHLTGMLAGAFLYALKFRRF